MGSSALSLGRRPGDDGYDEKEELGLPSWNYDRKKVEI
jgi:hypothetical protein